MSVPASGHGEGAHHVVPFTAVLAPSAILDVPLEFEGGDLGAGWLFLFVARTVSNGTQATAELRVGSTSVARWTLPANGAARHTVSLPQAGNYTVRLVNPSATDTVRIDFYFDQSCNCAGKVLPAGFEGALVIFNFDFARGETADVTMNEPLAMTTRVTLATRDGDGGDWPADFSVVAVSEEAAVTRASPSDPWVRIHVFHFTASAAARYYFFVEAKAFLPANYTGPDSLLITPYVEVTRPAAGDPSGFVLAVLVVAAVALVARARRKPL